MHDMGREGKGSEKRKKGTHVGLMVDNVLPALDFTNSLLMNKPSGWVYLTPFGAVISCVSGSDILLLLCLIFEEDRDEEKVEKKDRDGNILLLL